ncbi:hypothetical protein FSP39_004051 [Pinctada imbricata]|uniref:Uncharacterized protein n=1 Tax=Pinctada imbricata TaxID=66713 RepID=A0AA88XHJ8_PINIB|nr:hypothetical protein FSP39_004051 [Pinctada imbricata]
MMDDILSYRPFEPSDVLSINNPKFADYLSSIYPSEFEVNQTTETNNSASYLDIMLSYDTDVASLQAQTALREYLCTGEIKELQCPAGQIITINRVFFGLKSDRDCVNGRRSYDENCCSRTAIDDCIVMDMNIQDSVNTLCSGKNKCRVSARGIPSRNMCRRNRIFQETDKTDFKVIIYHCIPAVQTEEPIKIYCGEAMRRYLYGDMITTTTTKPEPSTTTAVVTQSPTTAKPKAATTEAAATTPTMTKTTTQPPRVETTPEPSVQDTTVKVEMVTNSTKPVIITTEKQMTTTMQQKTMQPTTSSPGIKSESTTQTYEPAKSSTTSKETKSTAQPEPETKAPTPEPEAEYSSTAYPEPEPESTTPKSGPEDKPVTEPGVDKPGPMGCTCIQVIQPVMNLGMLYFPDEDTLKEACSISTSACRDDAGDECEPFKHIFMAAESYSQIYCKDHREEISQQTCFTKVKDDTREACSQFLAPPMSDDNQFEPETEEQQCKRLMEHQQCMTDKVKEECSTESYELASVIGEKLVRASFKNKKLACSVNKQPVQGGDNDDNSASGSSYSFITVVLLTTFYCLVLR